MQYKTYEREQMLDEDPAKREAWSAESSGLIYTTSIQPGIGDLL